MRPHETSFGVTKTSRRCFGVNETEHPTREIPRCAGKGHVSLSAPGPGDPTGVEEEEEGGGRGHLLASLQLKYL